MSSTSKILIQTLLLSINFSLYSQILPIQTSTLFSGSGNCAVCHQPGSPNPTALLTQSGDDVSPVTLWRSTFMANASKDPFWQAKVTAEVLIHPQFQTIIEDKCTTCHAPLGRTESLFTGQTAYSLIEAQNDSLALDGVSCSLCHQIKDINLGLPSSFSGQYIIENDRLIYGPYSNPLTQPMQMMVNYTPVFADHIEESKLCGTCHTLFTPTIDNSGQINGEIAEQTPYLEWLNSIYPGQNIQCQTCHMPELLEPITISNRPPSLGSRSPFARHEFVGGNLFMLKLLKANAAQIGVAASPVQFDSTIARTLRLLQQKTAEISAVYKWLTLDTLEIKVTVENKSGHKFPTGYPSRLSWIFLRLKQSNGVTLFQSGDWDTSSGEIRDLDIPFETHYDLINDSSQVQIYQSLMQDVDSQLTYTLLRGASYLKDNRIPPAGFTSTGPYYDSTAIAGGAINDLNFNRITGVEGSGTDTVTYRLGRLNHYENYQLELKLLYHSLEPRFVQDLLQYTTPEIQMFNQYYQPADKSPVIIDSLEVAVAAVPVQQKHTNHPATPILFSNYPNPFNSSTSIQFSLPYKTRVDLMIYSSRGALIEKLVSKDFPAGNHIYTWDASDLASGIYFYKIRAGNFEQVKSCLLLK
jgi:hypothetical protein